MNSGNTRFTLSILSLCIAALVACREEPPRRIQPLLEPDTPPETTMHMGEYFEHVNAAQVAIIRGDLDGVHEPAVWIAEHESIAGLALPIEQWSSDTPEGWEAHDPEIRAAARRMAEAQNFEEAAAACGLLFGIIGTGVGLVTGAIAGSREVYDFVTRLGRPMRFKLFTTYN